MGQEQSVVAVKGEELVVAGAYPASTPVAEQGSPPSNLKGNSALGTSPAGNSASGNSAAGPPILPAASRDPDEEKPPLPPPRRQSEGPPRRQSEGLPSPPPVEGRATSEAGPSALVAGLVEAVAGLVEASQSPKPKIITKTPEALQHEVDKLTRDLAHLAQLRDESVLLSNRTAVQMAELVQRNAQLEKDAAISIGEMVQKNAALRIEVKTSTRRASEAEASLAAARRRIEELESIVASYDDARDELRIESPSAPPRATGSSLRDSGRRRPDEQGRPKLEVEGRLEAPLFATGERAPRAIGGATMTEEEVEALFPRLKSYPSRMEIEDDDEEDLDELDDIATAPEKISLGEMKLQTRVKAEMAAEKKVEGKGSHRSLGRVRSLFQSSRIVLRRPRKYVRASTVPPVDKSVLPVDKSMLPVDRSGRASSMPVASRL